MATHWIRINLCGKFRRGLLTIRGVKLLKGFLCKVVRARDLNCFKTEPDKFMEGMMWY